MEMLLPEDPEQNLLVYYTLPPSPTPPQVTAISNNKIPSHFLDSIISV